MRILNDLLKKIDKTNNTFKRILLLVLFFLSFVVFFVVLSINPIYYKYIMWIVLLFIPIPIFLVILGVRYYNVLGSRRNIRRVIITGFMIIFSYMFIFFNTLNSSKHSSEKYYLFESLEEKIDFDFPTILTIEHDTWLKETKTSKVITSIMTVNFDETNKINDLEKRIKEDERWLDNTDAILHQLVPLEYVNLSNKNNYYLIYIEELNAFNIYPSQVGVYDTYCFVYNMQQNKLKIYRYYYFLNSE